jgi:hypothetical protein
MKIPQSFLVSVACVHFTTFMLYRCSYLCVFVCVCVCVCMRAPLHNCIHRVSHGTSVALQAVIYCFVENFVTACTYVVMFNVSCEAMFVLNCSLFEMTSYISYM